MSEETKKVATTPAAELTEQQRELIALELESKRLEVALKKKQMEDFELQKKEREYNIRDLKIRLEKRDLEEEQLKADRESQGKTFAQAEAQDSLRQRICTHKKGGVVTPRDLRVLHTGGNKEQYAVIKHQMINGDIWILCLRCAKTWKPPVEKEFYFDAKGRVVAPKDGIFNRDKFEKAQAEYLHAIQFNTNNSMSTSVVCQFFKIDENGKRIDAAQDYREAVSASNLR